MLEGQLHEQATKDARELAEARLKIFELEMERAGAPPEQRAPGFSGVVERHISVYGADNDQRLTGEHETQSIDQFSFGVSDRGASIRIPVGTIDDGWKGRLEDRRPASNADPYKVAAAIIKTVKEACPQPVA